jgi:hypothetical protein
MSWKSGDTLHGNPPFCPQFGDVSPLYNSVAGAMGSHKLPINNTLGRVTSVTTYPPTTFYARARAKIEYLPKVVTGDTPKTTLKKGRDSWVSP